MIRLAVQSRLVPGDSLREKHDAALSYGFDGIELSGFPMIDLATAGFAQTYTLQQVEPDLARCMSAPGPLLEQIGRQIARDWLSHP